MAGGRNRRNLGLTFLGLALLGRLAAPFWPGFWLPPLALGLLSLFLAGRDRWRSDWAAWRSPAGRARARLWAGLALGLALALAAGQARFGPVLDLSQSRNMTLAPATRELLARLDRPLTITVRLGPQNPREPWIRELMNQFRLAAGGRVEIVFINPQLEPEAGEEGPVPAWPGSALVASDAFRENVPVLTEEALRGVLSRLLTPAPRLVYFLYTFGEKLTQDQNPGGLSQWAQDLEARRILALDYYWAEGAPLPAEAAALVLAGPRAPLGELRERSLLAYLQRGGRLLVMVDPLISTLSQDFWRPLGLIYPDGLVIDPEASLGGTAESYVISRDYPGHSLTRGLSRPILWPLAGAFLSESEGEAPVYVLAESSTSAWLETDAASLGRGDYRYQAGEDTPGPLALAVAADFPGEGGRLAALADSDLAANGFWGFPGNRAFLGAVVNWLLDEPAADSETPRPGAELVLSGISARLAFWLPTLVWPALILGAWFIFYRRRRRDWP
ncbi:MAG: GldG family protein [Deltaproteobacteria bacterium]|nr:GldG family protein [Deltaproteobacteria bacterium]